jgi:hypothetical protein
MCFCQNLKLYNILYTLQTDTVAHDEPLEPRDLCSTLSLRDFGPFSPYIYPRISFFSYCQSPL